MSSYVLPRKIARFAIFRPGMPLKTWLDKQSDKPDILLNASLYQSSGKPIGTIIENGKMVNNAGGGFGFGTADGASVGFGGPWDKVWKDYLTGYYGIVQQGKAVSKPWTDEYVFEQKLSRIAFGQLKDGRYAVFTANGVNIDQMAVQGVQAGFESLCNLDGGGSRALYWLGSWVHISTRTPYNAIAIWLEPDTKEEKPMRKTFQVCLDAGHYGNYNAGAVKGYYESVRMWKLTELLAQELTSRGITVIKTRSNQKSDLSLISRGKKAKGCDLAVSMHSNGASQKSVDYPAGLVFRDNARTDLDERSAEIGLALAKVVQNVMGTTQSARTMTKASSSDRDGNGIRDDEYYGFLEGARQVKVPGVILEHSFHTNPKAAAWLMSDANLAKLAKAEADCIAEWLEGTAKPVTQTLQVAQRKSATFNKAYKTTADLNMRAGAGTDFPVLTTLPQGATFRCYGFYNVEGSTVWLYGVAAGKKGYCSKAYLK